MSKLNKKNEKNKTIILSGIIIAIIVVTVEIITDFLFENIVLNPIIKYCISIVMYSITIVIAHLIINKISKTKDNKQNKL